MSASETAIAETNRTFAKFPLAAALVALVGLGDSVYLTVKHYTAEPVPCSVLEGCEQVLTSKYAVIGGFLEFLHTVPVLGAVPLASAGAFAYLAAIGLALVSLRGLRTPWLLFGAHVAVMAAFSAWLIYIQAFVIGAFCQYCLLSAGTTFTLLLLFIVSLASRRN